MGRRGIGGMLVDGGSRASAKIFLSRCKLWHSCSVLQPLRDHPRKMARRERGAHANSGICRICPFLDLLDEEYGDWQLQILILF